MNTTSSYLSVTVNDVRNLRKHFTGPGSQRHWGSPQTVPIRGYQLGGAAARPAPFFSNIIFVQRRWIHRTSSDSISRRIRFDAGNDVAHCRGRRRRRHGGSETAQQYYVTPRVPAAPSGVKSRRDERRCCRNMIIILRASQKRRVSPFALWQYAVVNAY